jgi:hypothetical protein
MDVESNGGSTYQAIGVSSPIYSLSTQVLGTFESNAAQYGSSEAETKIIPVIRAACTKAGNPILTEGQVNDLIQLATGTDANSLKEVTIYATGTDGH